MIKTYPTLPHLPSINLLGMTWPETYSADSVNASKINKSVTRKKTMTYNDYTKIFQQCVTLTYQQKL